MQKSAILNKIGANKLNYIIINDHTFNNLNPTSKVNP